MADPVVTKSEAETVAVGRSLGRQLAPGSVVLLWGDLGAGKTAFVRGIAEGLGADPRDVSSPTFTLIQEYRGGRVPLYHADLYRLTPREAEDLGLYDVTEEHAITAVEWPDRLSWAPDEAVAVRIDHQADGTRAIRIGGAGTGAAHSER